MEQEPREQQQGGGDNTSTPPTDTGGGAGGGGSASAIQQATTGSTPRSRGGSSSERLLKERIKSLREENPEDYGLFIPEEATRQLQQCFSDYKKIKMAALRKKVKKVLGEIKDTQGMHRTAPMPCIVLTLCTNKFFCRRRTAAFFGESLSFT